MSDFISESTGIEGPKQLEHVRVKRWKEALLANGLSIDPLIATLLYTAEDKALALQLWIDTAAADDVRRAQTRAKVIELKAADQTKYFSDIGEAKPGDLSSWLNKE